MTIFCLGSINIDRTYRVRKIPEPGETLRSSSVSIGLGGKGANTSVALAAAGMNVAHIGAISNDPQDGWILDILSAAGVNVDNVAQLDAQTGHAIVQVTDSGENAILVCPGANECITPDQIEQGLESAQAGDWLVVQNETNNVVLAAKKAKQRGLKVAYVAAPFDVVAVAAMLEHVDLISMNEIEAADFEASLGKPVASTDLPDMLVTMGAKGAAYYSRQNGMICEPACHVTSIVDTTCAGDTYFGFFLSVFASGQDIQHAMKVASAAASLTVQKQGAAASIPHLRDVRALLAG